MVFKTGYRLMQVKSIAEREHSAILLTFIKLPVVTMTFVLSIFEWQSYTGFTVPFVTKTFVLSIFEGLFYRGFTVHCRWKFRPITRHQGSLDSCTCAFKDGSMESESQDAVEMFLKLSILTKTPLLGGWGKQLTVLSGQRTCLQWHPDIT